MSIDVEEVLKKYIVKKADKIEFKHNKALRFPILPFITKLNGKEIEKLDFGSFDGYIGHCYRQVLGKSLPESLENEEYKHGLKKHVIASASKQVRIEAGLEDKFAEIIEALFFNGSELIKYSVEAQAYLYWRKKDSGLSNIADFIHKIFIDPAVAGLWRQKTGFPENILQQLLNKSLPELAEQPHETPKPEDPNDPGYHVFNPGLVALFKQDFEFLNRDKQSFLQESDLLFKYYYFLYVVQLANSLNHFFQPHSPFQLYFTLESETVSENRQTIKTGWKLLEPRLINMMSHSVGLDMINRLELGNPDGYDYQQLRELFAGYDQEQSALMTEQLQSMIDFYTRVVPVEKTTWEAFDAALKVKPAQYQNEPERLVLELFHRIEFQFDNSTRKAKRLSFANWFLAFCKKNFLKNRGRNGYSLNLTQEMLLFITKLCIGDQAKIRFNDLITAFNLRGIYFDEGTLEAIVEIYEKINLIEKKSDSGDAQYIRRVL